jgi:hypothetical protein
VAGKADKPDLASVTGCDCRLDGAVGPENPLRIVVVVHFMELPDIDHVRAQPSEAVFKLLLRSFSVPAADLGHQYDLVPASFEGDAHTALRLTASVFPGVVHKGHAGVYSLLNQANRLFLVDVRPDAVTAAKADNRDGQSGPAEFANGHSRPVPLHAFPVASLIGLLKT